MGSKCSSKPAGPFKTPILIFESFSARSQWMGLWNAQGANDFATFREIDDCAGLLCALRGLGSSDGIRTLLLSKTSRIERLSPSRFLWRAWLQLGLGPSSGGHGPNPHRVPRLRHGRPLSATMTPSRIEDRSTTSCRSNPNSASGTHSRSPCDLRDSVGKQGGPLRW